MTTIITTKRWSYERFSDPITRDHYDDETISIVEKHFKADIEYFGYEF